MKRIQPIISRAEYVIEIIFSQRLKIREARSIRTSFRRRSSLSILILWVSGRVGIAWNLR